MPTTRNTKRLLKQEMIANNELATAKQLDTFERFWDYHVANPHVYDHMVRLTDSSRKKGHQIISIAMLFEVFRWEVPVSTTGVPYKISNDYKPYYARLIMLLEPKHQGFFRTKPLFA